MVALTDKTQKDSRSMRILTFIAMIYLPASLVMVSFNLEQAEFPPSCVTIIARTETIY